MKKTIPTDAILVPQHAECKFVGDIFDVYQWDQELYDGSSATFEMLKRPDTILVLGIKDRKIVIVNEEQPNQKSITGLPGGRADPTDKSWEDAAKREMLEETGMSFADWRLIDVVQPVRKIEWFVAVYLATGFESQVEQKLDAGEMVEVIEMDFQDFKEILRDENRNISDLVSSLDDILALPAYVGTVQDR